MTKITIAIADDNPRFRRFLSSTFKAKSNIDVVFLAPNCREALMMLNSMMPEVLVAEVTMDTVNELLYLKLIHSTYPDLKIIACTLFDIESIVVALSKAGVKSIVNKTDSEEMVKAVNIVAAGGVYYPDRTARVLQQYLFDSEPRTSVFRDLSEFEFYLLSALYRRQLPEDISSISNRNTVEIEYAKTALFEKFGAASREELLAQAIRLKLI